MFFRRKPVATPALAPDGMGRLPLWYQAMDGDLAGVTRSIADGADVRNSDKNGFSVLHVACEYGHRAVVQALIKAGADVNATDRHGNGPLWVATRKASQGDDAGIVADLLEAGASATHENKVGKAAPCWAEGQPALQAIYQAAGYSGPFQQ